MRREDQKSLSSQASFIPLSVLWNFPGVRPATADVFCNPATYLSYINACFSKGGKQLPRLDLELAVALEKVEAELALQSEGKLNNKNPAINSYITLVMQNALNDQDTLKDYQIIFEHEKFNTKFSPYSISFMYARILEQALQIGRDASDPRTVYVLNKFLEQYRNIKQSMLYPETFITLVNVLVKWGLYDENRETIHSNMTQMNCSSGSLDVRNSIFKLTKIFLKINDIHAVKLLIENRQKLGDRLDVYLLLQAFILMEKNDDLLILELNQNYNKFFSDTTLFKEYLNNLKSMVKKIKSNKEVDFKFIFDQVIVQKDIVSSIIESFSAVARMTLFVQKDEYSGKTSKFLAGFAFAALLDEVFKNPELVSKFIEYCCQNKSCPEGTAEYFENSDAILKLNFEDRKKLVTVMPFVNTSGITKLISGLSNEEATQLLTITAKKSTYLSAPGNRQHFDASFMHAFLFESHNPKIDYFEENNKKEKSAEVAVPVILAYANTLTAPTGALVAVSEKDNAALQRIPLALYVAMVNKGHHSIPAGFYEFLERYDKANQYAGEARLIIDYKKFMMENIFKIVNLYEIFGDDLFSLMMSKLATSVLKLSKFFDNIQIIPNEYFPLLRALNCINAKNKYDYISTILLKVGQCESLIYELGLQDIGATEKSETLLRWEGLAKKLNPDLTELENEITKTVVSLYRKILNIAEDVELDCTKLLEERELIGRLLIGRSNMQANQYSDVFDRLVTEDLRVGGSFQTFSNDVTQEDELGKRLATHNQKIIEELNAKAINAEFALNYPMKKMFTTEVDAKVDVIGLCHAVWQDLLNFEDQLKKFESKWEAPIKKILALINKVKAEVEKGKEANPERLKSDSFATLFKKIISEFDDLARLENIRNIAPGIIEHGTHFKQRVQALDAAKKIKDKNKKMPNKTFRVEQWDKSDIHTFVLGDRLSCCLAPDGGQFQAMVQRRMDAAMLMHVVIDEETNQPVCGNWLFFARDKNNPEDVYVVANFYEIRAGYAENPELRDKLVSELTEFTANYAKAIGAKGYLIRPLTYGMIPDMKDKCDTIKMNIEKIGGFFDPKEDRDPEEIVESYYLEALKLTEIHQYRGNTAVPAPVKLGIFHDIPKPSLGHNERLEHRKTKLETF